MKTLKELWSGFYLSHEAVLTAHYPGIQKERFLREMGDLLQCDLGLSQFSFSQASEKNLQDELLRGRPFAYLLGFAEFYHHRFYVNENVLIPRPETELLVDMMARKKRIFEHVLDVGTGSGVLLLSLVKAGICIKGTGSDISTGALEVAAINRRQLRLENQTQLIHSDRFSKIDGSFDLIVSNPPYIKKNLHRELVQKTVDTHEPHLALYLPDAEYEAWFEAFFNGVKKHLKAGGEFWMEGHENELSGQAKTLKKLGFREVEVIKDYSGLDRFLTVSNS